MGTGCVSGPKWGLWGYPRACSPRKKFFYPDPPTSLKVNKILLSRRLRYLADPPAGGREVYFLGLLGDY
jgi:hypothetical protein